MRREERSIGEEECGPRNIFSGLPIPLQLLLSLDHLLIAQLLANSSTLNTEDTLKKQVKTSSSRVVPPSLRPAKVLKLQWMRKAGNNFAMKSSMELVSSLRPWLSQALQTCLSPWLEVSTLLDVQLMPEDPTSGTLLLRSITLQRRLNRKPRSRSSLTKVIHTCAPAKRRLRRSKI